MCVLGTIKWFGKRPLLFYYKNDDLMFFFPLLPPTLAHISLSCVLHALQSTRITWQTFLMNFSFQCINRFHYRDSKLASSEVSCSQQRLDTDQLIQHHERAWSTDSFCQIQTLQTRSTFIFGMLFSYRSNAITVAIMVNSLMSSIALDMWHSWMPPSKGEKKIPCFLVPKSMF